MKSGRGRSEVPISLFSFQDIITSVSGIMILLVLLFALDVATHQSTASTSVSAALTPDRSDTIQRMREDLENLRQQAALRQEGKVLEASAIRLGALTNQLVTMRVHASRIAAQATAAEADAVKARQTLTNLLAMIEQKRASSRIRFIRQPGSKDPVLLECQKSLVRCGASGGEAVREFSAPNVQPVLDHIKRSLDPARQCIVVMIRPSSVTYAMALVSALQSMGFEVGWDALEEDSAIVAGGT